MSSQFAFDRNGLGNLQFQRYLVGEQDLFHKVLADIHCILYNFSDSTPGKSFELQFFKYRHPKSFTPDR